MSSIEPERTQARTLGGSSAVADFLRASILVAGVFLLLLAIQTAQYGRPGLEKMLTELAMPVGLLWCGLTLAISYGVVGWWRPHSKARRRGSKDSGSAARGPLLVLSIGLWLALTCFGNRSVADWGWDQTQYPIAETIKEENGAAEAGAAGAAGPGFFDAVILLGGGISADAYDRPQLARDGDRVRPPLQLWHAGRVARIFVTGTSPLPDEPGPADLAEELLISFGVPASAITQVPGRNTSEEMKSLREVLAGLPVTVEGGAPRVGLVTSAYHMPRALRLARGEGLELVPLPVAYHGGGAPIGWSRGLVPTADAMADITACWKEWLAATVGR